MEPVFMVLGKSAAIAAMQAQRFGTSVQTLDYAKLRASLLEAKQVLAWTWTAASGQARPEPPKLEGIVIDVNHPAVLRKGFDVASVVIGPFIGTGYRHDDNARKGEQSVEFLPDIQTAQRYDVRIAYSPHGNRASRVPVTIRHADGENIVMINQQQKPPINDLLISLGTYRFQQGRAGSVIISNCNTDGYVVVDAVQFLPAE
jgi:hypothetical protein